VLFRSICFYCSHKKSFEIIQKETFAKQKAPID